MKKSFRHSYTMMAVILAALTLIFAIPVSAAQRDTSIESVSRWITVADRNMHVVLYGGLDKEGTDFKDPDKKVMVLLPGLGVTSSHIYFKPLAQELATEYNVVIPEPFGYGLSDLAGTDRTVENMNAELKSVLDTLGIKKCILAGHSISGIYGMNFIFRYPEMVQGFISIDGTVYDEGLVEALEMEQAYMIKAFDEFEALRNSFASIQDFQDALTADPEQYGASLPEVAGYSYTKQDQQEYIQAFSRCCNQDIRDEIERMKEALLSVKGKKFPSDLPVLTMVCSENVQSMPAWKTGHEDQLDFVTGNHSLYVVEGGHYIWYTNLSAVAGYMNGWNPDW